MKILLYNIEYGTGLTGWKDYLLKGWRYLWPSGKTLRQITHFLEKQDADVICLIEIDAGSIRTGFHSQVDKIAKSLNWTTYKSQLKYTPRSPLRFFPIAKKQHNAIFSKRKGKFHSHYLKSGMKRLVQEFMLDEFHIFLVHLGLRESLRKKQLKQLSSMVKKCPKEFLICGDFNASKGVDELGSFIENNQLKLADPKSTYPSENPQKELDLILVSQGIRIKKSGVFSVQYSDHLPIWVDIDIENQSIG